MTALAYVFGASLLAFVVGLRLRAVRRWNARLAKLSAKALPVHVQHYTGAIPKPLTPAQMKAVQERRDFLAREKYKPQTYRD